VFRPFHIIALLALIKLIFEMTRLSDLNGNAGLEVIGPFVLIGAIIIILLVDFLLQRFVKDRKKVLVTELLLIAVGVIFYFLVVN
jgi:hypothetical protein